MLPFPSLPYSINSMHTLILHINSWWNSRESSAVERQLAAELEVMREQVLALKEQNAVLESKNHILLMEQLEFQAVMARNLQRVKAETKVYGGNVVKTDLPGDDAR